MTSTNLIGQQLPNGIIPSNMVLSPLNLRASAELFIDNAGGELLLNNPDDIVDFILQDDKFPFSKFIPSSNSKADELLSAD